MVFFFFFFLVNEHYIQRHFFPFTNKTASQLSNQREVKYLN